MVKRLALSLVLFAVLFVTQPQPTEQYIVFLPMLSQTVAVTKGVGATYPGYALSGIRWFYDWSHNPPVVEGVEAVPMIWGAGSVGKELGGNSDWVLGPNECELETQCNLTVAQLASLWRVIEDENPGRRLVSPAVQSLGYLSAWWDSYILMYGENPRLDAVATHCYGAWTAAGGARSCQRTLDQFVAWATERDISEVWVTEYSYLPCWPDGIQGSLDFMEAMQIYFDYEQTITRYAWFQLSYKGTEPWAFGPKCNTSLIDFDTGEPTTLGKAYQ